MLSPATRNVAQDRDNTHGRIRGWRCGGTSNVVCEIEYSLGNDLDDASEVASLAVNLDALLEELNEVTEEQVVEVAMGGHGGEHAWKSSTFFL